MTDQQLLQRIAANPRVMGGKPVIKGARLTVDYILNLLAHGATVEEIELFFIRATRGSRPKAPG